METQKERTENRTEEKDRGIICPESVFIGGSHQMYANVASKGA